MIDEKRFDYENYIQRHLREIDDLDERKYARELLLESLGKFFAWTDAKYEALEQRISRELSMPGQKFHTCMTIVKKEDYDPINNFWFPVCEEDVIDVKDAEQQSYETIYLMADEKGCREFLKQGEITGVEEKSGKLIKFRIRKAERYEKMIKRLYMLFTDNHIPWQVVHMGHLDRFFELVPMQESVPDERVSMQWEKWEGCVKTEMIPLWNIQRIEISSMEFRVPCIDEVFYEHIFFLPDERVADDGYLMETEADILSLRYEESKVVLKSRQDSLKDVCVYRLHQEAPAESYGYQYPVLSNSRKDNLAARYLHQTGNFIQTPMELSRKIKEMSGCYEVEILGYEITDKVENNIAVNEILYGDMNGFGGAQVFSDDKRSTLLFKMRIDEPERADYLCDSQVRYILSQLQMEFMEYKCVGVLV